MPSNKNYTQQQEESKSMGYDYSKRNPQSISPMRSCQQPQEEFQYELVINEKQRV